MLEVGAGLGGSTKALAGTQTSHWLCLEPDPNLAAALRSSIAGGELPAQCEVRTETLASLNAGLRFDSILYIDVLEHIADDAAETRLAAERLNPGGKLVVLAPAHQWLFSPFDSAVGHHRRYTRDTLRAAVPNGLACLECKYLDSVGLIASAGNRFISRQSQPQPSQISVWDGHMVPLSRRLDPWLGYRLGKSVLGVWQRPN